MQQQQYYSASIRGFINRAVWPENKWPEDAVEISDERFAALMDAQSAGMVIQPGEDGLPVAVKPEPPIEQIEAFARQNRNAILMQSDWSQLADIPSSIKQKYVAYRQELRDLPQQEGFPENIEWPVEPV